MSVEVRGSGRGRVGVVYTLTCTVTLSHRARDSSVSIQWPGPSTDEQTTDDTTGNRVVTRQLSLDPLTLAHGGTYTCTAQYIVNGVEITTGSGSETVAIDGIYEAWPCIYVILFKISFRPSGPSETRGHHIHGCQVRQCHHPVDSCLHILLSRDICSTVWH